MPLAGALDPTRCAARHAIAAPAARRRRGRHGCIGGAILAAGLSFFPRHAAGAVQVPMNFVNQTVVGGLDQPTSFAFLPDGRVLVTEQVTGKVRLVVNGHIASTDPVFVVPSLDQGGGERGLLGIAVDPRWPVMPFVYLFHSRTGGATRIVRYLASDDVDVPNGEHLSLSAPRLILDDIPDQFGNHNGGTLRFGADGCLYASIGDDAVYCDAADSTTLRGEILRLRVDALPIFGGPVPPRALVTPPDNPFAASPDSNARLVYAFGLRNPFRFHIDPSLGTVYAADVGQDDFEEVDEISPGDFLGWPWREGNLTLPRSDCPEPGGLGTFPYRHPILVVPHSDPVGYAIISAGMYRPVLNGANNWPPEYSAIRGDLFYGQYYEGYLRRLHYTGSAWVPASPVPGQPNATDWATGLDTSADFLVGPDGSLWWVSQFNESFDPGSGKLQRIVYVGPSTGVPPAGMLPGTLRVAPNPARESMEFAFALAAPRRVRLGLYDLSGRRLRTLLDGEARLGETRVRWNGKDENGARVPAGVYFARLDLDGAAALTTRVLRVE